MGSGAAKSSDGKRYYIVVNYEEPGNAKNRYLKNLPEFKDVDINNAVQKTQHVEAAMHGKHITDYFGEGEQALTGWISKLHHDRLGNKLSQKIKLY